MFGWTSKKTKEIIDMFISGNLENHSGIFETNEKVFVKFWMETTKSLDIDEFEFLGVKVYADTCDIKRWKQKLRELQMLR